MLSALQNALTKPGTFFEREADDPRLLAPALVVAAVALVSLVSSVPVLQAVSRSVGAGARPFVLVGLLVGSLVGMVVPFVVWLLYSLVFYGISALFDGDGEFRDLFALVGWGFAPSVVSGVVGAVVTFVLVSNGDFSDPQAARQMAQASASSPLALLNRGVDIAMTLWSAWVWTYAVRAARDVELREAAITVGVVVAVSLGTSLLSSLLV